MPGRTEFEFQFGQPRPDGRSPKEPDDPLRILIVADLSGRSSGEVSGERPALAERTPRAVSIDNIDKTIARFAPNIGLPGPADDDEVVLQFSRREDFHPDRLLGISDLFGTLRRIREELLNPATFPTAAAELRALSRTKATTEPLDDAANTGDDGGNGKPSSEEDQSTLERLLGKKSAEPSADAAACTGLARILAEVVGPHIVKDAHPEQATCVTMIDDALAAQLRAVLHNPAFQRLEATWRAVEWLLRRVETGAEVQICLLDATEAELSEDFAAAGGDLESSALHRILVGGGVAMPGGKPWSLVITDFSFGAAAEDMKRLAVFGAIAREAGGALIASAAPSLLGCESLARQPDPGAWTPPEGEPADRWQELRRSFLAPSVGLTFPRFLVRAPYGAKTDPLESLAFEEITDPTDSEQFLWAGSAFACALSIAAEFLESGWAMDPDRRLGVDDLPSFFYSDDGETRLRPSAEIALSERAATSILGAGIMPVLAFRDRNEVRLGRFQSIADPPTELSGGWS